MNNTIESHDPLCARSDLEAAWNGAECSCPLIRLVRSVEGIELMSPSDYVLERINAELSRNGYM